MLGSKLPWLTCGLRLITMKGKVGNSVPVGDDAPLHGRLESVVSLELACRMLHGLPYSYNTIDIGMFTAQWGFE